MNGTSNSYIEREYKAEDDQSVCISDLSPSAIRGANKLIELSAEVALESILSK
tara:strand:+ start:698 stop:856 length:159 start_codon:yes stop_codon:yes gene_type:complete